MARCLPRFSPSLAAQEAGNLSIVFDLGGVLGGALAGALADASGAAACVSVAFVAASVPALVAYRTFGAGSLALNLALMAAAGLAVNGPYALITTAVSADLGSHRSLAGVLPRDPARVAWLYQEYQHSACSKFVKGMLRVVGFPASSSVQAAFDQSCTNTVVLSSEFQKQKGYWPCQAFTGDY